MLFNINDVMTKEGATPSLRGEGGELEEGGGEKKAL